MVGPITIKFLLWGLFSIAVFAVCILTLAGFLGRQWWLFDLVSHFRRQYLFILMASSLIFLLGGQPRAAAGAAIFTLINLALVAPFYFRPASQALQHPSYKLLLSNVFQPNNAYDKLRDLIHSEDPDFIVLIETNRDWLNGLQDIRNSYPYLHSAVREDKYGLALFSRIPVERVEVRSFCATGVPSIIANFHLGGNSLTLIGTHPPPPKGATSSAYRNQQLGELAEFTRSQVGPLILCGDLNLTPWSPYFRLLLRESGLKDSTPGFGVQPTWPADQPLLRVPIDHCLVSPGIEIVQRKTGPDVGSDHYPVIVDFSFGAG